MKAEIAVLIILIMALIFPGLSSVSLKKDEPGGLAEHHSSRLLIMSVDAKRLEERMNGALQDMISQDLRISSLNHSNASTSNNSSATNASSATNVSAINSSTTGISIKSSASNTSINSPANNISAAIASAENSSALKSPTLAEGGIAGQQGMGASTSSKFNGYYGISSSQHQMGKNDIDSSTFLSGSFSMEKSVKFQDIGI